MLMLMRNHTRRWIDPCRFRRRDLCPFFQCHDIFQGRISQNLIL